jgi:hypothetical protein
MSFFSARSRRFLSVPAKDYAEPFGPLALWVAGVHMATRVEVHMRTIAIVSRVHRMVPRSAVCKSLRYDNLRKGALQFEILAEHARSAPRLGVARIASKRRLDPCALSRSPMANRSSRQSISSTTFRGRPSGLQRAAGSASLRHRRLSMTGLRRSQSPVLSSTASKLISDGSWTSSWVRSITKGRPS